MKLDIKKLIKDPVIKSCCTFIFFISLFLVLNLGFGVAITRREISFERNYSLANWHAVILFVLIVVVIIRFFLIQKERPAYREVLATVRGELEKESLWKKDTGLFLHLSFDMDGNHFERKIFAEYSTSLVTILEKGSTKVLVKDPEAKRIVLPELVPDEDF